MEGQELIIKFKDGMAFLTQEVALNLNQIDVFNSPIEIYEKFKSPSFWLVRVLNYDAIKKRIFADVISFQLGDIEFSENQIILEDSLINVEKIDIKKIDTILLLKTKNYIETTKILDCKDVINYKPPALEIHKSVYIEPFFVSIKELKFCDGKVLFDVKIQALKRLVKFEIFNENIVEEYDAVKNYFESVLKTKRIQVVPEINVVNGEITAVSATSAEVDRIDKSLIEEFRFKVLRAARSKDISENKHMFTTDEYLKTFARVEFKKQGFFNSENDLLDNILKKSKTKHYNHLRFLSSKHKTELLKLRIVHKPFSFIFLLGSSDCFFVVWETLDTQEATYIWSFSDKVKMKQIVETIDSIIASIIEQGREQYINREEDNFNRIFHNYKDQQNGFIAWKNEIELILQS